MDDDDLDFDASAYDKPIALSWKSSPRTLEKASFGQKLGASDSFPSSRRATNGSAQDSANDSGTAAAQSRRPNSSKPTPQDQDVAPTNSRSRPRSKQFGRSDRPLSFATSAKKVDVATGIVRHRPTASASSSGGSAAGLSTSFLCDSDEARNIFAEPAPRRAAAGQTSLGSSRANLKPVPSPAGLRSNGTLSSSLQDATLSPQSLSVSSISHSTKSPVRSRGGSTQTNSDFASSSQETSHTEIVPAASQLASTRTADAARIFAESSQVHSRSTKAWGSRDANGTRRKRARTDDFRRRSGWLSDEGSPTEEYGTRTTNPRNHVASALDNDRPAMYRHPAELVAKVRVDAYAGADAGSTQFFRDEVLWCCSNIVGSNVTERLQAATDLAIRISDTATYSVDSIVHEDVMRALIQLVSFCRNLVVEGESKSGVANGNEGTEGQVKRFVVMILHYLSLFCCDERQKRTRSRLHVNNAAHRAVRRSFVSSTSALQGIVCLVLSDPRVAQIRGKKRRVGSLLGPDLENIDGSPAEPDCSQSTLASSVASTPESVGQSQAASIPSTTGSNGVSDPTLAGRLRRAGKRRANAILVNATLSPISEARPGAKKALDFDEHDEMSFVSSEKRSKRADGSDSLSFKDDGSSIAPSKPQKNVQALLKRVSKTMDDALVEHTCGTEPDVWSESIPLLALSRVMTGKLDGNLHSAAVSTSGEKEIATFATLREEEDEAVIRDERLVGGSGTRFWEGGIPGVESDTDREDGPFQVGNRELAESGIVSLLAVAVADTLSAVVRLLNRDGRKGRRQKAVCVGCVSHLRERLRMLVSIVDASCLFCDENRVTFCQGGHSDDLGGYLIVGLVSVLSSFCDAEPKMFSGVWADIVLETLRLLLSLTHESQTAARELEIVLPKKGESGLGVISRALHASSNASNAESVDSKHTYDCSIFCLNILTNYLESGGSSDRISELPLQNGRPKGKGAPRAFLSWVSNWLVGQTSSFRDAVMESTFGTSPSKHSSRTLEGGEEERLVMAGNGFVLLAWILVDDDASSDPSSSTSSKVRDMIEAELPGPDRASKRTYLRNTLKAFCNFYHASVGDMSVVIVDPVKKLIQKLEGPPGVSGVGPFTAESRV